jgi:hypothetical protein
VVEHDALDASATLAESPLGLLVGSVDLEVVLAFAGANKPGVEGLVTLRVTVSVAFPQTVPSLRQRQRVVAVAGLAGGLD